MSTPIQPEQSKSPAGVVAPVAPATREPATPQYGRESPLIYEGTRLVAAPLLRIFGHLHVEGLDNIPHTGPVILAINHIHWMDIPFASLRVPRATHYMAKIELFQVPVLGGFIKTLGAFPVRRGEGDRESLRIADRILADGNVLMIFPEGHRSGNGALAEGHPGAAYIAVRSGAPIVPVAIFGTEAILKRPLKLGPWAPRVTVRYGKPFTFEQGAGKRSRDSMAKAADTIMRQIAALLPPQYRGAYADPAPAAPTTPDGGANAPVGSSVE